MNSIRRIAHKLITYNKSNNDKINDCESSQKSTLSLVSNKVSNLSEPGSLNGKNPNKVTKQAFKNENIKKLSEVKNTTFQIHNIAQTDRLDEFQSLYYEDPSRLKLRDKTLCLPIHHASKHGRIKIIEFILEKSDKNMINEQNSNGDTPLHIAIQNGNYDCCKFLIDRKADLSILNYSSHSTLHCCVAFSRHDILELILTYKHMVDINIPGESGGSPLHYCAYFDNLESAKILIKHGAELCGPCFNGFFPIHLAASRGSNKVLKYLLDEAVKKGIPKLQILSLSDGDNNKPLHSAVQFNNIECVKLCIENGAHIDETTEPDNITPIHLACAQGSLEILKVMFELEAQLKDKIINMPDKNLMTPLHKACMFDHVNVAKYLLENGAYIDSLDKENRSPLLLASSRNCVETVCFLLKQNASIKIKDTKLRNLLHLIINQPVVKFKNMDSPINKDEENKSNNFDMKVHSLHEIAKLLNGRSDYMELLNDVDEDGCTVIHYASQLGYVSCLRSLIKYGAKVTIVDSKKQLALHFAAKYGRYNSCLQFLLSPNYKNYINEKDNIGCTPLHLAAQNGHAKVVKLLIQKGALIFKSYTGNNAFHEAASNGHTSILSILYNFDPNVLNSTNKNGDTPLHLAAREGHFKVIEYLLNCGASFFKNNDDLTFIDIAINQNHEQILLRVISHYRWNEVFDLTSSLYKTPLMGIIELSSEVTQAFLERCISRKETEKSNQNSYMVTYNFKYVNWSDESVDEKGRKTFTPMLPLLHMVNYGRIDCLSHSLCETILRRKWNKYGFPIYGFSTFCYIIFLLMLTMTVTFYPSCIHDDVYDWYSGNNETSCYEIINNMNDAHNVFNKIKLYTIMSILCIIYCGLQIINEAYHFMIDESTANITPWISILRTIIMMIGEIDGVESFIKPFTDNSVYTLHYDITTVFFLILFIILVPILLTNLLIGLAVGDIEGVQKNAKLKRQAMQIYLHVQLESRMPKRLLKIIDEPEYTVIYKENSSHASIFERIFNFFDNSETVETINDYVENNQLVYEELIKLKQRIGIMKNTMDQQSEFLKLIIRKMEIKTEEDDNDTEITQINTMCQDSKQKKELWSPRSSNMKLRNLMMKQFICQDDSFDENNAL